MFNINLSLKVIFYLFTSFSLSTQASAHESCNKLLGSKSLKNLNEIIEVSSITDDMIKQINLLVKQNSKHLSIIDEAQISEVKSWLYAHPLFSPAQLSWRNSDGPAVINGETKGFWWNWPSMKPQVVGPIKLQQDTGLLLPPQLVLEKLMTLTLSSKIEDLAVYSILINDPRIARQLSLIFLNKTGDVIVLKFPRERSKKGPYLPGHLEEKIFISLEEYLTEIVELRNKLALEADMDPLLIQLSTPTQLSPLPQIKDLSQLANPDLVKLAKLDRETYFETVYQKAERTLRNAKRKSKQNFKSETVVDVMKWLFNDAHFLTEKSVMEATKTVTNGLGLSGTCYLRSWFGCLELKRLGGSDSVAQIFARGRLATNWRPSSDWSYHVGCAALTIMPDGSKDWLMIDDYTLDEMGLIPIPDKGFSPLNYDQWKKEITKLHVLALDPTEKYSPSDLIDKYGHLTFIVDQNPYFDSRASLYMNTKSIKSKSNKDWLKFNMGRIYISDSPLRPESSRLEIPASMNVGFPFSMRQAHFAAFMSWIAKLGHESKINPIPIPKSKNESINGSHGDNINSVFRTPVIDSDFANENFSDLLGLINYVESLIESSDPTVLHLLSFTPSSFLDDVKIGIYEIRLDLDKE